MRHESQFTDDQLRLATTRSLPADEHLDSDTAAAREAFLSLGASLEATASDFDQSALLARLEKTCLVPPASVSRPSQLSTKWLAFVVAGALAAAALIAIVRIANESQQTGPSIAMGEARLPTPISPKMPSPKTRPLIAWNDSLGWNDPLDDEIALASATIEQFASRNRGFDDSLLDMNDQLRSLSEELTNETL